MSRDISKRICCTCLCVNRKLFQLYRIPDGVNLLYMLLQFDADIYKDCFFKDPVSWLVCWECRAIIKKIKQFRAQTCTALKQLRDIVDGRNNEELITLSHLSTQNIPTTVILTEFIDCGLQQNIKEENREVIIQNSLEDDKVTSCLKDEQKFTNGSKDEQKCTNSCKENQKYSNSSKEKQKFTNGSKDKQKGTYSLEVEQKIKDSFVDNLDNEHCHFEDTIVELPKKKQKRSTKNDRINKFYNVSLMDDNELKILMENRKSELNGVFKCDTCGLGFKDDNGLNTHNSEHHTKKENHSLCDVCLSYINTDVLETHTKEHYMIYSCNLCSHKTYKHDMIVEHLNNVHIEVIRKKKKKECKSKVPMQYPCLECDMYFENKGAKWKHVQKCHRAGHKCSTCEKVFTFKHNLERHELSHSGRHPLTPCPVCHKLVRTVVLGTHARTHAPRARHACAPCGRAFVSRATYETHLKYARAHTTCDVLRYGCTSCEKKYRSRGELRDHVAYRHDNQPRHKCPVCDKALATRRCVTRHVRRAHEGIKENALDKICDYCGQAFRDKKSLTEHVSRHTGARPHSCARCGRAFRQRAALYAHSRRLHPDT